MTPETIPSALTSESLLAANVTTNIANLDGIDIKEYIGKLKVVLNAGVASGNNQSATVSLQTSAVSNANFVAFDPAIAFTAVALNGGAAFESKEVDTRVANRYLRALVATTANGNGRPISVTVTGKKQVTA